MRGMRIAYVINSVEGGGAASPVPAVLGVLRDGGASVAVFALTPRDRRGEAAMQAAGIDVHVRDGGEGDHLAALRWLDDRLAAWAPTHLWTSLTRATLLGQLVGFFRLYQLLNALFNKACSQCNGYYCHRRRVDFCGIAYNWIQN